jgi:hypothetical protein
MLAAWVHCIRVGSCVSSEISEMTVVMIHSTSLVSCTLVKFFLEESVSKRNTREMNIKHLSKSEY